MPKNITFEQAVTRLEEIAELLESEDIALDESIKLYEEGMKMAKVCSDRLKDARQKITELSDAENEDGADSDD